MKTEKTKKVEEKIEEKLICLIEDIFKKLVNKDITDIDELEYNITDGTLKVNGKEIEENDYVKEMIDEYKENISLVDDCTFVEVLDETPINLKNFDILLNKKELTEEEKVYVVGSIRYMNEAIYNKLIEKIASLESLLKRFEKALA